MGPAGEGALRGARNGAEGPAGKSPELVPTRSTRDPGGSGYHRPTANSGTSRESVIRWGLGTGKLAGSAESAERHAGAGDSAGVFPAFEALAYFALRFLPNCAMLSSCPGLNFCP